MWLWFFLGGGNPNMCQPLNYSHGHLVTKESLTLIQPQGALHYKQLLEKLRHVHKILTKEKITI